MGLDIRRIYQSGQKISDEPLIYTFENYLSDTEINALVDAAESNLQRALVSTDKAGIVSKGRTGRNCWISHQQTSVISRLADRISALLDIPLSNAESFQIIHYYETQEYSSRFAQKNRRMSNSAIAPKRPFQLSYGRVNQ